MEISANERTLRRAINRGAVRCRRDSPRVLAITREEIGYLRAHWRMLAALSRALRTEPNVRLAVLYGSVARGDDRDDSDIDLLLWLRNDSGRASLGLGDRLERELERSVDVARLPRVRETSPLLLLEILGDGRVLVDRDGLWPALQAERPEVASAAARSEKAEAQAAAAALAELLDG